MNITAKINTLTAIEKAIAKFEIAIEAYKKEAGNVARKKEVDRNYFKKASALLKNAKAAHKQILNECWGNSMFF